MQVLSRPAPDPRQTVRRIIGAYASPVVRAYALARFGIVRQRFLAAIGEHLPASGRVLDVGCGFGLFSLYYAARNPALSIEGVDLSPRRVAMARDAARRLGFTNVRYEVADARTFTPVGGYDAAYMLDIVHHVDPASVPPLLGRLAAALAPGGVLVVKDVDDRPAAKRLFTWALDKLLSPRAPVRYWSQDEVVAALAGAGFDVLDRRRLPDWLPYPHVLYIARAYSR